MTAAHGRAEWYGDVETGPAPRTLTDRGRARPRERRAESHHYLAVLAAEVRRMAGELGSTPEALDTRRVG
jgi:hypothetical protein